MFLLLAASRSCSSFSAIPGERAREHKQISANRIQILPLLPLTIHATARQALASQAALKLWRRAIDGALPRLVHCTARVPVLGSETRKQCALVHRLRRHQPEEGVMLHAGLPQLLRCLVRGQLETDCRLVLFEFSRANLKVKVVTLVRDLQDLWPRETIDPQPKEGEMSH